MRNFYKRQREIIQDIISKKSYKDFGIERGLRLFCAFFQYVSLANYIRYKFDKNAITRKTAVEVYMIVSTFLPFILVLFNIWNSCILIIIITYLLIETVLYLITLVVLPPNIPKPISSMRNFISLFFNYMQLSFAFAVYYLNAGLTDSRLTSLYFSIVTQTTVGYGDVCVQMPMQKILVIIHIFISILFTYMFFAYFISFVNNESKSKGK